MGNSNNWGELAGGLLIAAVTGLVFAFLGTLWLALSIVIAIARGHDSVVVFFLSSLGSILSFEADADSTPMKLAVGAILTATSVAVAYCLILVGTHLDTIVILGVVGAAVSIALCIIAGLRADEPRDYLSGLRFWEGGNG